MKTEARSLADHITRRATRTLRAGALYRYVDMP